MNFLIVGCGITGISLARKLAESSHSVTVIDSRDHIGGNCFDYFDANGIDIHKYGTHIFHTDNEDVWRFLSRFTQWYPYQHEVKALVDGQLVPIPFNFNTIEQLFPAQMANRFIGALLDEFAFNKKIPMLQLRESQSKDLRFLAEYVYEKVFLHYTVKQWGVKPDDLDPLVTGRVPVFIGRDNRYFQAKYQGIPLRGYTEMFRRMLEHTNINLELSKPFDRNYLDKFDRCFYTGPIDEFFNYQLGELPYRSLKFNFLTFNRPYFQCNSVVNYPNNYDFTRIGEYKYFLNIRSPSTVVSYEYPEEFVRGENERYYPVINDKNRTLYQDYLKLASREKNVAFLGRLGDYKYYDMDQAVARVLELHV
ncbi:UDP-galactopyranose mutase [Parasutterella muris]|uniref:UDP-galactopyranose mutase n=1 Tax=Parasutterella muris TaxID=2565572 RepID=UPI00203D32E3|nr:UDP-galactopyranose mutase [Parasutterella muris]